MKGHRQIEHLRLAWRKPAAVFVTIGRCPPARFSFEDPEAALAMEALPEVFTDDTQPFLADLRFLLGCRVHLTQREGSSELFWQWHDAIAKAGASAIFGVEPDGEVIAWRA